MSPQPQPNPSTPPLLLQITEQIRQELVSGGWPPGAAIPGEAALARRFQVSQGTIRKAIDELVREHRLIRHPGKGVLAAPEGTREMPASAAGASNGAFPAEAGRILSKAVVRASRLMGLNQTNLAQALGVSTATASRLAAGHYALDPHKKEWELAALLVRVFRALDSIVGGSETHARAWIHSENTALHGCPADLLVSAEGLVRVLHYLDAARSRL